MKSVTGSFAQHLKGTPTECHDPLDQADGGLYPTSLPEDMGSRVSAPCSGGAHDNMGQRSHTPPWTALLLAPSLDSLPGPRSVRSGGKQALTSSLEALSPLRTLEPESASSQPWRVQQDTGVTCRQPAGSDTIEERKVRGYGSASYPTCPSVCRFALGVFKEQGLDLGGSAQGHGPLFCKAFHATPTASCSEEPLT